MQGSPSDLTQSGIDFVELIGTEVTPSKQSSSERDAKNSISSKASRKSSTRSLSSQSSVSSSDSVFEHDSDEETNNDTQFAQMESSSKGKVKSVQMNYFRAGGNCFFLSFILVLFVVVQALASAADYWVSFW